MTHWQGQVTTQYVSEKWIKTIPKPARCYFEDLLMSIGCCIAGDLICLLLAPRCCIYLNSGKFSLCSKKMEKERLKTVSSKLWSMEGDEDWWLPVGSREEIQSGDWRESREARKLKLCCESSASFVKLPSFLPSTCRLRNSEEGICCFWFPRLPKPSRLRERGKSCSNTVLVLLCSGLEFAVVCFSQTLNQRL